jgi:hypothetical protein
MAASERGASYTNAVLCVTEIFKFIEHLRMDTAEGILYLLTAIKILNTANLKTHMQAVPVSWY